VIIMWCISG